MDVLRKDISYISEKPGQMKHMFFCFQKLLVQEPIPIQQKCTSLKKAMLRVFFLQLNGFVETINKGY